MKKRLGTTILTTLLSVLLVFNMAGCGKSDPKDVASTSTVKVDNATQATETTQEAKKPVTIKVASWQVGVDSFAPLFKKQIEEFPKSKLGEGVTIEVEEIPGVDAYSNKMKILISSGDLPNVIQNTGANLLGLGAKSQKLADLTAYFNEDTEWKANFDQKALDYNSVDGKIYGVPLGKEMTLIFYNKDLFKKANVEIPTTWDEFFLVCEKLKAANITPIGLDTNDYAWATSLIFGAMIGTDGDNGNEFMVTKYPKEFSTPEVIKAAGNMQKLFKDYTTKDAVASNFDVAATHFYKEQVAMIANGPWMVPDFKNKEKVPDGFYNKVGVFAYPNNAITMLSDLGEMVGADSDKAKVDASVNFLKFISSPEMQVQALVMNGKIPSSTKVQIPEDLKTSDPLLAACTDVGLAAKITFGHNQAYWYPNVLDAMVTYLPHLAFSKITPEDFCKKLSETAVKNKE